MLGCHILLISSGVGSYHISGGWSPPSNHEGTSSIWGQCMDDYCWTGCHWDRFSSDYSRFFMPFSFHHSSIPIHTFITFVTLFFSWLDSPSGPRLPRCWGFELTLRHTTLRRSPVDEWSDPRRDLYLITHNTHKRQTSMPPTGFEPSIPASEEPQTHILDHATTRIDTDDT